MMRHSDHARRKDKPRVLWHPDAPATLRQPPSLPEVKESSDENSETKSKKQRKPSPKRKRLTKFKEPQLSDQELEIARAFEAKASWRTETWDRSKLDARLQVVKNMESERHARRPKTPEEPSWKGVVEPPPGGSPLSKKMYGQIKEMVHIPEVERPVDMERTRGQPFHGEELRKLRERDRARRKAAEVAATPGNMAQNDIPSKSPRAGRASASPTIMSRRSPHTPTTQGQNRSRTSPLTISPPRTPLSPQSSQSMQTSALALAPLSPQGTPSRISAKQRWAGARTKLKVAAVMGAQLKEKREQTSKVAARSRWRAAGLLAKKQAANQKQAAKDVEKKVMTGAIAWKNKAARRKEKAAADAAADEQRAKNKAMFAAAVQGDVEVVRMALQEGAEAEARNAAGLTVTQLARERNRGAVVKAVATFQREQLEAAVLGLWTSYNSHLEKEGEEAIGAELAKSKKTAKMLWKKAAELVDPNPIASAAEAKLNEQDQEQTDSATAALREGKQIQAALDRAKPVLVQLETLEGMLRSKASQEDYADIVPQILDAHKKKLSRMRKWKRKVEAAHRKKVEKDEAWAKELNSFKSAARQAELNKLEREAEDERAKRAAMEEAKAAEKKRLALEVAAQRRAVELAEIRAAAKQRDAARQQARDNLDRDRDTGEIPASPSIAASLNSTSRRILLSPVQNHNGGSSNEGKMASPLAAAKMRRMRRASITRV